MQKISRTNLNASKNVFIFSFFFINLCTCISSSNTLFPRFPSSLIHPEHIFSTSTTNHKLYKTKYFTQTLDHFNYNPQSYQTFQQRYLVNDKYWGGVANSSYAPIFVYTGNEGDIEWFAQNTGFLFEIAPHFKALIVFIEHRYYGKSIPYGGDNDVAYSNATTLGYLSSEQALADYATLIIDLKKNLTAIDCPVVVFGGSYGGMLAAWFRLKYPHVAIGALASSAPILNFENITSTYAFNNIITQDFRSEGETCYETIKKSWKLIEATAKRRNGLEKLRKSFRICKNYINAEALANWISTAYIYTAMTDYPTPSNFLNPMPAYPIRQMCKAIEYHKPGEDTFEKLYKSVNIYYNYSGNVKCFDLEDHSDPHGLGGWTWQVRTKQYYKPSYQLKLLGCKRKKLVSSRVEHMLLISMPGEEGCLGDDLTSISRNFNEETMRKAYFQSRSGTTMGGENFANEHSTSSPGRTGLVLNLVVIILKEY